MKTSTEIKIRKQTQPQWLIWLSVMLPFLFGALIELVHLPWSIRYVMDIIWILLLFWMIRYGRIEDRTKPLALWLTIFLIYTLLTYLLQYQSGLYYLWGARNNFRCYVIFFAYATFLTTEDVDRIFDLFDTIFWANAVLTLIQYFALDLSGDYLGGIFGTESGANAYTNIFCIIVVTRSLVMYLEKKKSTWECMTKCGVALLVAVLAELKFFFVEVLVIIAMAVFLTNFTWRKFGVVAGGVLAVFAGAFTISVLFPDFAGWFSIEWLISEATSKQGYTYAGDLNRLNAIPMINDFWLRTDLQRIFGLGLGNCDTSSIAVLDTPFYKMYGHMHYSWLSYAYTYLECGWIGLIFFVGFFGLLYLCINRIRKRSIGTKRTYCRMALILTVMCMMILIYNGSLRTEAANMLYFSLAVPFVKDKKPQKLATYD